MSKQGGTVSGVELNEVQAALEELRANRIVQRIWEEDASVWSSDSEHVKIIANSLGWLRVADELREHTAELETFAKEIRDEGFTHAVVLGMGGSSLCPEVLRQSFGKQDDYPELLVLTTEPQMFQRYFYERVKEIKGERAGENFIAITDPGTVLEGQARDDGYRRIFINWDDIGGRYSALSFFGMVPFAIMGGDVDELLERAIAAANACKHEEPGANPGAALGALLGTLANKGVNKLTLIGSPQIASLGLWIEQLVAESTGKLGKGIVPVAGEELGSPEVYGKDRVFVSLSIGEAEPETSHKLQALETAGFTVVHQQLSGPLDLGATFFVWEFATAVAGSMMKVDAFDQPNVQESKDNTKRLLNAFVDSGTLPEPAPLASEGALKLYSEDHSLGTKLDAAISAHLAKAGEGDYVAITQYFLETDEVEALVQRLRLAVRAKTRAAVTTGYGPRFLHSTGQLHKGGANSGVFLQLTAQDAKDVPIPREPFGFSILKQAQALGDFESLVKHGRRAVRVDLGVDVPAGLRRLLQAVEQG